MRCIFHRFFLKVFFLTRNGWSSGRCFCANSFSDFVKEDMFRFPNPCKIDTVWNGRVQTVLAGPEFLKQNVLVGYWYIVHIFMSRGFPLFQTMHTIRFSGLICSFHINVLLLSLNTKLRLNFSDFVIIFVKEILSDFAIQMLYG